MNCTKNRNIKRKPIQTPDKSTMISGTNIVILSRQLKTIRTEDLIFAPNGTKFYCMLHLPLDVLLLLNEQV